MAVAFERSAGQRRDLAHRLLGASPTAAHWPELVHIATDGETYGHHHRHGEMALTYALRSHRTNELATLTNYGEYLEHPPTHEVEIFERTSWSCVHGVERWRSDCGCNSGRAGWNQEWRAPLREALDGLRDTLAGRFEEQPEVAQGSVGGPRRLHRCSARPLRREVCAFLADQSSRDLSRAGSCDALKLLEMQRHAMLMYTSCGWFFDELSGIETVQVIQYAGRAIQLAKDFWGDEVEANFLEALSKAKSNLPEHGDGRQIYDKWIRPTTVTLDMVAAHYGISSLFKAHENPGRIYCYTVDADDYRNLESGRDRLALACTKIPSEITWESACFALCALHLGDHNLSCGVRLCEDQEAYDAMAGRIAEVFSSGDIPETVRAIDRELGSANYSTKSLFRDDQRMVLRHILDSTLEEAETAFRQIHEHHAALIHFLGDLGVPLPKPMAAIAEFALNGMLRHELEAVPVDVERVHSLMEQVRAAKVNLDATTLEYALRKALEPLLEQFAVNPNNMEFLDRIEALIGLAHSMPFEVVLWRPQNIWFNMRNTVFDEFSKRADAGDADAAAWVDRFLNLGRSLLAQVD